MRGKRSRWVWGDQARTRTLPTPPRSLSPHGPRPGVQGGSIPLAHPALPGRKRVLLAPGVSPAAATRRVSGEGRGGEPPGCGGLGKASLRLESQKSESFNSELPKKEEEGGRNSGLRRRGRAGALSSGDRLHRSGEAPFPPLPPLFAFFWGVLTAPPAAAASAAQPPPRGSRPRPPPASRASAAAALLRLLPRGLHPRTCRRRRGSARNVPARHPTPPGQQGEEQRRRFRPRDFLAEAAALSASGRRGRL